MTSMVSMYCTALDLHNKSITFTSGLRASHDLIDHFSALYRAGVSGGWYTNELEASILRKLPELSLGQRSDHSIQVM